MTILTRPWRIDRRGERIYIDAPGEVCIDLCSGTPEDRARVMALLEQVQDAMTLLRTIRDALGEAGGSDPSIEYISRILRAAGILDESDPHGRVES